MNAVGIVADGSLLFAIPIAVLAGLISFLSPCVLPLVPGYLGFIGGAVTSRAWPFRSLSEGATRPSETDPRRRRGRGTRTRAAAARGRCCSSPVSHSFSSASRCSAAPSAGFFLEYADAITRVLGVVIIAMGLVFIGVFGLAQRTIRPQVRGNLGLSARRCSASRSASAGRPASARPSPSILGLSLRRRVRRARRAARARVLARPRHPVPPARPRLRLGRRAPSRSCAATSAP